MKNRISLAFELVKKTTPIILEKYQGSLNIELKGKYSEVSEVDRMVERIFRDEIYKSFPDDGVIGEEYPDENLEKGEFTWTVDPIDGTASFIRGVPFFGMMIGLIDSKTKEIQFGVIHYPALNETIYAKKGEGSFWKPPYSDDYQKCEVSKTSEISNATFCYSAVEYFRFHEKYAVYQEISSKINMERSWGDCYGYSLVATGRADIMMDPVFYIWDLVPVKIVVEEAGGIFTGRLGENDIYCNSGLASNGNFHNELVDIVRNHEDS